MRQRVLLLIKGLNRGGAERLLADVLRHRDRDRFHYELAYLLRDASPMMEEMRATDVPIHCLDAGRSPAWVERLSTLVRRRAIAVVHAHAPYPAIGARTRLWGSRRPKLVYTEHSTWTGYRRPTYWANMVTFPRNDHVFAVSKDVRASLRPPRALAWLPMPPVETLYHGVDIELIQARAALKDASDVREELGIDPAAPVVGSVANFTPQKDHAVMLEAITMLRSQVPGLRVVLVGGGPLESDVRARARALGLEETVVFTGARPDAVRVASCFDVFTLSSTHEGFSIALLEAMALGKPAVVTSVGGLPEAVSAETGYLVPPRDPGALARALSEVLANPALCATMGEAARSRAADFDVRHATRRIEEVYSELLS